MTWSWWALDRQVCPAPTFCSGPGPAGRGSTADADVILWATGFRAALDHLGPLHLRAPGGGIQLADTRTVLDPRVHLVGYGPSASTIGAGRAGRAAVREIRALLADQDRLSA